MGVILLGGISDKINRFPLYTTAGIAYTGINEDIFAETVVYVGREPRRGILNGQKIEAKPGERSPFELLDKYRDKMLDHLNLDSSYNLSFESNNYKILSGSSDAGAAAMGRCVAELCGDSLNIRKYENDFRTISESVGRSLYGGLTITPKIEGQLPKTEALLSASDFADYVIVACHFESSKRVSADLIHENIVKHKDYWKRIASADARGRELKSLAGKKDIKGIFELAKRDTHEWHGLLRDVGVRIITEEMQTYMNRLNEITSFWNSYLVVSGSNVFTFVRREDADKVKEEAIKYNAVPTILRIANSAHIIKT